MGATISTAILFLFGGIINSLFADPKCNAGLERLQIAQEDDIRCDCIATESLFFQGFLSCTTSGVVDVDNGVRGDTKFSQIVGAGGSFLVDEPAIALFFSAGTSSEVYELQLTATPDSESTFGTCEAEIFLTNGLEPCTSCTLCDDKVSFRLNCNNLEVATGVTGPVFDNCLNLSFQLA